MPDRIHADGDTWHVTSDDDDPRRDVRTVVFHCVSNSQRPYRVVEVPPSVMSDRSPDALREDELGELFQRSHTMDFSHDPGAEQQRLPR